MSDIRWKQRFNNYCKAFQRLADAVALSQSRELTDLEQQGLIQSFEFTHELAWNVLKDFLEEKGIVGLIGSKDATRSAFKNGLIEDGESWMKMIEDRNKTSHTYDLTVAKAVAENILKRYSLAFEQMLQKFTILNNE